MRIFFSLLVVIIMAAAAPASAELVSGIAAVVNEEVITTVDLDQTHATLMREAEKRSPLTVEEKDRLRALALNQLIDRKLVEQKIKELNIRVSEEEVRQAIEEVKKQNHLTQEALTEALRSQGMTFDQYREQFREQLERLRLMSQEVRAKVQVGDKEIKDYYEASRKQFSDEEKFHARHIFFRMKKDAAPDDVKRIMATAMTVLQEAREGKDFAALARKHSDDPAAATDGGDLGAFRKGEMLPEIEGTVLSMQEGQVSDIVSTPAGFHIIKLEERIPGRVKPLEEVQAEIEDRIYKQKSEQRFNQWLDELKKSASIEIKRR